MNDFLTMRRLEEQYWSPEIPSTGLTDWYLSVRDTPINLLGVGDVCRAIRQELFLDVLLALAVDLVAKDILIGAMFDGELVSALSHIKVINWVSVKESANRLLSIISLTKFDGQDELLLSDVKRLINNLNQVLSA